MISIIFLCTAILLLVIILLKLVNCKKNNIIFLLITLFIFIFIINIKTSLAAVVDGLKLCLNSIIPTMFPFSVICNLLICYDGISIYSKFLGPFFCKPLNLSKNCSFPLVASFICGYPLGAKYCSDIFELGYINRDEYTRLLNIASNCGPIFILGVIGTTLLNNIEAAYILLASNYISIIIIGIITRNNSKKSSFKPIVTTKSSVSLGDNFKNSIENAINTTLSITGFIVIFSVLISLIKENTIITLIINNIESYINIPTGALSSLFLGSIEITNGCSIISSSGFSTSIKLGLISFLCSFSGLSIIAQSSSFISKHGVSIKKYTLLKILQGVISFGLCYFITFFYSGSITAFSSSLFLSTIINPYVFILPTLIIIIIYFVMYLFRKLFFHTS